MSYPKGDLTKLAGSPSKKKIIVYDLESKDGETQQPGFTRVFLAGMYDGARFSSFRDSGKNDVSWERQAISDGGCIDQLMQALLVKRYRGHFIYAHNGGSFDHLHVLPWLRARNYRYAIEIVPIQSSIQALRVKERGTDRIWTFVDSLRLLPMTLEKASKTFGFKGKLEHDLFLHEDDPKWEQYLFRDCEALFEALTELQHLLTKTLGGEMGVTAPASAMKLFRRRYMGKGETPDSIPRHQHFSTCKKKTCNGCLHEWIRKGYYGGRTEVFRPTGKQVRYYDINSSYPRAMLEGMPAGRMLEFMHSGKAPYKGDWQKLEGMTSKHVGFVECEVNIPESCYLPPLPYRDPKTEKLIFPVGRFSGVWPMTELFLLHHSLVGGHITKLRRSVWFEKKTIFYDFVKELYSYRDKNNSLYDEGLAMLSKLMMNSLYGKFGMNEERREIIVMGPNDKMPDGAKLPQFLDGEPDVLSRTYYMTKNVSPVYVIPQISAEVTAQARKRLWLYMAEVLKQGKKLYYCDTDSIVTDAELSVGAELGALKDEYPGEKLDVEFVGPKMYLLTKDTPFQGTHKKKCKDKKCGGCCHEKLRMKGVPGDFQNLDTLRKFQRGEEVHFKRLEKLGRMAGRDFKEPPEMRGVFKSMKAKNDKRDFLEIDSKPRVMGGLENGDKE